MHGKPDAQGVLCDLLRIERDANGKALDDFDPVAGRVLSGDRREGGACTPGEPRDAAVIDDIGAIEVGSQLDRLAGLDAGKLHFLEIGIDVHLLQRHDDHDRRAGLDALTNGHAALIDNAGDWCPDDGSGKVYLGLIQLYLRGHNLGIRIDRGVIEQHLIGMARAGSGIAARLCGSNPGLGLRNRRPRLLHDRINVIELLSGDDVIHNANTQMVRRARTQAGNLAHGLKTPLAVLTDEARRLLARGDTEGAAVLTQQTGRMQRQIDFQLARARAAANAGLPGVITQVEPAFASIAAAMRRLYAHRELTIVHTAETELLAAVDPNDLDEMVANLVDNACKWARGVVSIKATRDTPTGQLLITIVDDGPGIPADALNRAFAPGERLDEAKPGSGLGLAIVRDLATLHGGSVELSNGRNGGLHAELRLPSA